MATIYDVAKVAGVSPKTVSRVLNGDGLVKPTTQAAVREAMAKLGYVPSSAARSIKSRKSGLIGLITGAISLTSELDQPDGLPDLFIVQGILSAIEQSNKTLLISDTGGHPERIPELIRTFQEYRVEGLIYATDFHRRVDWPITAGQTKWVLINCYDDMGTPAILPDDRRGQFDLVSHLITAGHTRIAYLTLAPNIDATKLRLKGYRDALKKFNIAYDPELVTPADIYEKPGDQQLMWDAVDRLLCLDIPPTVICCGNDRMAITLYGILRSRGIAVPDQISVAGYDNHRTLAERLYPPLTTVELPYRAMGSRGAQQLLSLIEEGNNHSKVSKKITVVGSVFWRESVTEQRTGKITQLKLKERRSK